MAGDWIKMRVNLWDDPRVASLVDATDSSEAAIVGALYWLWATADQHTEDGVLPGLTLKAIDRKTGVAGFGAALCVIGWLIDNGDGVRIVHFEEHNGTSAKGRAQTARRVASCKANATVTLTPLPEQHKPVTTPLPREEKRREEINTLPPTGGCPVDPDSEPEEVASPDKPGFPDCPYAELRRLWKTHLPHLTQPRVWDGQRRVTMRNRWTQAAKPSEFSPQGYSTESGGISWWDSFFGYIASDTTLSAGYETNGRTWKPDLEWVCNAQNFQKIIDGKYAK